MKGMKLKAKYKRAWVKALRGGDYTQGTGRLVTVGPDGAELTCCMGVATDIFVDDDWVWGRVGGEYAGWMMPGNGGMDPNHPPALEMRTWFKGSVRMDDILWLWDRLSDFNDDDGRSFKWIASWIERYL